MSDTEILTEDTEMGLIAYMFTNHAEQGVMLQQLLDMFYRGVYANTIGVGSLMNTETGEEELVLVGLEHREDGLTDTYPLARVLGPDEIANYVFPDGKGGWLNHDTDAPEQLELELNVH